ncbi:transcriptional regulator [Qipengyuania sp. NPDC077410]|uniref:transcriptional regulator n=1 Tax=Qipengyuania sp. NPDC077410 TaxID=3364496 RepID=UPI0037C9E34A
MTRQYLRLLIAVMTSESPVAALKAAIAKIGSQGALARFLGISQPSVWKWVSKGKVLPAQHVLKVEAETGISRHDLRPDLYPREDGPAQPPVGNPSPAPGGSSSSNSAIEGLQA